MEAIVYARETENPGEILLVIPINDKCSLEVHTHEDSSKTTVHYIRQEAKKDFPGQVELQEKLTEKTFLHLFDAAREMNDASREVSTFRELALKELA